MSLVSVIMPTHNAERWVVDTLDNLNAQTWPHIELIVVDDASSDGTVAAVRRTLADGFRHPWQIIELDRNVGPSAARNVALKAVKGDWVQYLDSDDFLAPDKLALQMAVCEAAPADVAAVYSPWRRCYFENGEISWEGPLVRPTMAGRAPLMCLVGNDRVLHGAGLARRSVLDRIGGFDETLRFWECEEVTVRLAKAGRLEPVPSDEPLYLWRVHREAAYIGGEGARYQTRAVAQSWIEQMVKAADGRTFDQMGLSPADRADILADTTEWARRLYGEDLGAFRQFVQTAKALDPRIGPAHPAYASAVSRVFGYEAAEAVARLGRIPGALLRRFR